MDFPYLDQLTRSVRALGQESQGASIERSRDFWNCATGIPFQVQGPREQLTEEKVKAAAAATDQFYSRTISRSKLSDEEASHLSYEEGAIRFAKIRDEEARLLCETCETLQLEIRSTLISM